MKQSLIAGLLTTYALAGDKYRYQVGDQIGDSTINIDLPDIPKADLGYYRYGIPSSGSFQSADTAISNAISNARGTLVNEHRSIDSLFLKLPSLQQLDRLILNTDSVAILKTIQVVATDDSLTCDQRISYLLEIFGRIRSAIEKKQFAVDQLRVIIEGANAEIQRLLLEVDRLQDSILKLDIKGLQSDLKNQLRLLESLYKKFNAIEREIAPREAEVAGYKRQITIIQKASDAERNRISTDKLKLTEARARIRDLETRLAEARQRRGAIEASIKNSEEIIRSNQIKIDQARDNISLLEIQIVKLTGEVDRLRGRYSDLEIEVQRLRTEIAIAEAKADGFRAQIAEFRDRITKEESRLYQPELDEINEMIATLKRAIPSVQSEIDRHYYYCYGEGAVQQTVQTGGVVVYIVKGQRFRDYLQTNYGSNVVTVGGNNLSVNSREISFQNINIFGNIWSQNFGYPFADSSLGGDSNQFDIAGSFNCLNPSKTQQGVGRIKGIYADYFDVEGYDGQQYQLQLGSCSRLEGSTNLPKVGQRIAYSGVPSGRGKGKAKGLNLYRGSCF